MNKSQMNQITINGREFSVHVQLRSGGGGYYYSDGLYLEAVEILQDGYSVDRIIRLDESDISASYQEAIDWIEGDGSRATDVRFVRFVTEE